jgi:hypothetical protein
LFRHRFPSFGGALLRARKNWIGCRSSGEMRSERTNRGILEERHNGNVTLELRAEATVNLKHEQRMPSKVKEVVGGRGRLPQRIAPDLCDDPFAGV